MGINVNYIGNLECESTLLEAQATIINGAPADNHGKGDTFSPTDLLAAALAQCALLTIAIRGKDQGININNANCLVEKKISDDTPRRIVEFKCVFQFTGIYTDEQKQFIQETVRSCPVASSLNPEIKIDICIFTKL